MKKTVYILISMLLIVSVLASCGEKTTETKKESSTSRTAGTNSTTITNATQTDNTKLTITVNNFFSEHKNRAIPERTLSKEELKNSLVLYKSKWRERPDTLTPKYFRSETKFNVNEKSLKTYDEYPNIKVFDYENGVVIAKYKFTKNDNGNIKIPEIIGGKPVIGIIGQYTVVDVVGECREISSISSFYDRYVYSIHLPKTIKYIEGFDTNIGNVYISKDNPYYWSKDGAIYTKDRKTLLFATMYLRSTSNGGMGKFVIPN